MQSNKIDKHTKAQVSLCGSFSNVPNLDLNLKHSLEAKHITNFKSFASLLVNDNKSVDCVQILGRSMMSPFI